MSTTCQHIWRSPMEDPYREVCRCGAWRRRDATRNLINPAKENGPR